MFAHHFQNSFPQLVGKRVLVALSGGADSVALLHLLRRPELALDLGAAHVHHGVRGDEADGDAVFCEDLCGELSIPYYGLKIDPFPATGAGREATWRQHRYGVLLDLAATHRFDAVATGHHCDDVAEGVLVQLLRGGGPRALSGINETTGDGVIRPLLPWSRAELAEWLREHGLSWREDSSNLDPGHLRNLVRHRFLPDLEEASPSLRNHLVHLAEALAGDERYFSEQLRALGSWIDPWEPDGGVPIPALAGLPPALRPRWLHAQAARIGLTRVTRRQTELFESLVGRGEPRAVTLGGRWSIRRAAGRLWLEPPETPPVYAIDLVEDVVVELPLPGWNVRFGPAADPPPGLRWRFPADRSARMSMRSPRENDRVEVDGDSVRVPELIARKLPRHLRGAWPVCCESDRIRWIPGVWQGPEHAHRASHVVEVIRRERSSCVVQRRRNP